MATTTPTAVITAIKALIEGLTPSGGTEIQGMEKEYQPANDRESHMPWESRAEGGIDRHFQITEFEIQGFRMLGNTAERDVTAGLVLEIGHMVGNYAESLDRRWLDTYQLVAQLTWPPNIDDISGLQAIPADDVSVAITSVKNGQYLITTMGFTALFSLPANYGG